MELWVAMVQREVGERLAAAPGGGEYGVTSVIAQLACEVRVLRAIPRTSSIRSRTSTRCCVEMRRLRTRRPRRRCARWWAARSRTGARRWHGSLRCWRDVQRPREDVREALVELGHPADVRAERLSPAEFVALAGRLGL